jgi:hypothetical protein
MRDDQRNSGETAPEEFNFAVTEFLGFLRRENVANKVEWVFSEDLQIVEGRFYVRVPIAAENLARATATYRAGLKRGLGIELSVICWISDCAYSNVYVPDNDREAELHLMPTGLPTRLKLTYPIQGGLDGPSVRDERREAVPVKSRVRWSLLKRKGAKNEAIKLQLLH